MPDLTSTAVPPEMGRIFLTQNERLEHTEFVLDFVEKSAAKRSKLEPIWDEVLDNYFVDEGYRDAVPYIGSKNIATAVSLQRTNPRRDKSRLKDPSTNEAVDNLASQGIALLMPQFEFIQATPIGSDDVEKARYLERVLEGVLQSPGKYGTHFIAFKDAFLLGTAILEIGWETASRMQSIRVPVFDEETGFLIGHEMQAGEVVFKDGPLVRNVDRYDFFEDPSGTRIQEDMIGVAKRFRITKQKALRMSEGPRPVYDREYVLRAIANKDEMRHEKYQRRFSEMPDRIPDQYGVLTGFEFWGEYPGKRPMDGARNRVITLLEGVNVRSKMNPYLDGNIPFKEIVLNPTLGRFDGLSPAEVMRFLQDSTDAFLMTFQDGADMAVRQVLLAGHSWGGDPKQLKERSPLDVIRCANPDFVKPVPVDVPALGFAAGEYIRRVQRMRDIGGTNLPQSIQDIDRPVATGINEIVRFATQKVDLQVQLVEKDDYPWIGRTLHSRMRQFLDPRRQAILAGETFPMTLDEIDFDADIRFVGSRQAKSRFESAAATREALRVLSDPMTLRLYPELITRYLRDDLDFKDAERVVMQAQENLAAFEQQQMMMQQQAEMEKARGGMNQANEEVQAEGVPIG